ncbi:MAG: hypothetical protein JXM73_06880 [Anaerolineae bacterium]|nr:hypothetical protein [Anaerolineae bacterium]
MIATRGAGQQVSVRRIQQGRCPSSLTSYPDDKTIFDAIAAGADGHVLKLIGSGDLIKVLE